MEGIAPETRVTRFADAWIVFRLRLKEEETRREEEADVGLTTLVEGVAVEGEEDGKEEEEEESDCGGGGRRRGREEGGAKR